MEETDLQTVCFRSLKANKISCQQFWTLNAKQGGKKSVLSQIYCNNLCFKISQGTGQLIKHCYDTWQIKRYILGSGGSAFVDGGYGAMIGLGLYQLKDQNQLKTINYHNIVDVLENTIYNNDQYQKGLKDLEFILPCDVQNPMVGPNGAAFIFGPQKGAQQGDLEKLDQNMISTIEFYLRSRFGNNYSQEYLQTIADTPGTGAAGGLVACLLANFSDVKVISGMDYISQLINLEQQIQDSSVIFSGEGSFDSQTLEGKVVCKIHELCKKHSKPLVIVCGINKLNQQEQESIQRENENMSIFDLVTNFGIDRSMKDTANCLSELVEGKIIDHIKKYIV
ncbi:UNKNOWN [Stylonychia lemnae]|uniref:Glycerate kinase n=1 Tax=Stylonychia lemnae TaxID=5949 RepID=A0A078B3Y9_STYLE|nr:UNKNOWN [Stylonychia lemnae]|eukprot:CDW89260.1 UNKNOWN [Stylonychia lemnae]